MAKSIEASDIAGIRGISGLPKQRTVMRKERVCIVVGFLRGLSGFLGRWRSSMDSSARDRKQDHPAPRPLPWKAGCSCDPSGFPHRLYLFNSRTALATGKSLEFRVKGFLATSLSGQSDCLRSGCGPLRQRIFRTSPSDFPVALARAFWNSFSGKGLASPPQRSRMSRRRIE